MLCRAPYMLGSMPCGCGGCLPCRINRRRVWAHRILLESYKHGDNCFVTLTYNDDNVPTSLDKTHYQLWLKRLRHSIYPKKIRYFIAGEYGELTGRPHFHGAIFGLDRWSAGGINGQAGLVQDAWINPDSKLSRGFTSVGSLTFESAQYIAGYLTKKVVSVDGTREFSRMSLRPGIGKWAMEDLAREIFNGGDNFSVLDQDVPSALKHGKRLLPLGRYLRRELRGYLGFASKDTPPEASRMQALRSEAEKLEARSFYRNAGYDSSTTHKLLLDTYLQKMNNLESRFKIRDSKRSLR